MLKYLRLHVWLCYVFPQPKLSIPLLKRYPMLLIAFFIYLPNICTTIFHFLQILGLFRRLQRVIVYRILVFTTALFAFSYVLYMFRLGATGTTRCHNLANRVLWSIEYFHRPCECKPDDVLLPELPASRSDIFVSIASALQPKAIHKKYVTLALSIWSITGRLPVTFSDLDYSSQPSTMISDNISYVRVRTITFLYVGSFSPIAPKDLAIRNVQVLGF